MALLIVARAASDFFIACCDYFTKYKVSCVSTATHCGVISKVILGKKIIIRLTHHTNMTIQNRT